MIETLTELILGFFPGMPLLTMSCRSQSYHRKGIRTRSDNNTEGEVMRSQGVSSDSDKRGVLPPKKIPTHGAVRSPSV